MDTGVDQYDIEEMRQLHRRYAPTMDYIQFVDANFDKADGMSWTPKDGAPNLPATVGPPTGEHHHVR